ncbi:hypothetical protein GCM10028806_11000 [Spirosoma terrae]|uniref:Uncharacterized protein n=1 Tax=Spirosoma terrae TaxID=1968276 RepID=A0A6L9LPT0_9BACT|nr:hypothetical protein [Spirosoma terrae]NDU98969.1 hypothetical protein [Spirosoma terrae]
MKTPGGCLKILLVIFLVTLAIGFGSFYGRKFIDRYQRPWAYSTTEPLLIGRWHGNFRDPDGIAKQLTIDLFEPESDDERWKRAFRSGKRRRRSSASQRSFDGKATVIGPAGREEYEVWGHVDKEDYHRVELDLIADEKKMLTRPNFYVNDVTKGQWNANKMSCLLTFSYRRPDGSSFWNSADPRYSKKINLTLDRLNR